MPYTIPLPYTKATTIPMTWFLQRRMKHDITYVAHTSNAQYETAKRPNFEIDPKGRSAYPAMMSVLLSAEAPSKSDTVRTQTNRQMTALEATKYHLLLTEQTTFFSYPVLL